MESEIITWLASDNGLRVHVAVFILLLLGGVGAPVPEDIPLLLAGVAGSKGIVTLPSIFTTSYIGVVLADQIVYLIGFFFGKKLINAGTKSHFFPSITQDKVLEIREGLRKRRLFYIFLGRHLFPVRTVTFLTAGALHIPYWEFLLSDAFAALVSVAIVIGIGFFLGEQIDLEVIVREIHLVAIGIVAVCFALWLLKKTWTRRKAAKKCQANS